MSTLYDPEKVLVKATNLSHIAGVTHVEARLTGVPSMHMAERVRKYLTEYALTSDVGLKWDGETQSAVFQMFVNHSLPVDAVSHIRGLLGPQAQRFA